MHPDPAVREPVREVFHGFSSPNVRLLSPLAYPVFVRALADAYLVLTDSGGVQEEAPLLGVPVLVLQQKTARTEPVDRGTAQIVGTDRESIVEAVDTSHPLRKAGAADPCSAQRQEWERLAQRRGFLV